MAGLEEGAYASAYGAAWGAVSPFPLASVFQSKDTRGRHPEREMPPRESAKAQRRAAAEASRIGRNSDVAR